MKITAPSFDEKEIKLLRQCLASGWVTQGPMTSEFENQVATLHSARFALATTSCSAALHLSTMALNLKSGDEVIIPAFTWVTSAHAAEYVGAKAVFVDVDPNTFNIDPSLIEQAITPQTKAIVVVHLFGLAADMDPILKIAQKYNLAIIEDAACAIGATYKGTPVGAIGDIGCFSFHPRKIITTGEGGMLTTNHEDIAKRIQSLRNHGATGAIEDIALQGPWTMSSFDILGYNLRLSDIQAAVGIAQLDKLKGLMQERRHAADTYFEFLKNVESLQLSNPKDLLNQGHTYQSYVVKIRDGGVQKRNEIMQKLALHEIQTRPGTHSVPGLGYYKKKYNLLSEDFPIAKECEELTITLPIFPKITFGDQEKVCTIIKSCF